MKSGKGFGAVVTVFLVLLGLLFNGCQQDSLVGLSGSDANEGLSEFAKEPKGSTDEKAVYPQSAEYTYSFFRKGYRGGAFTLPNGSVFELVQNSLTPPPSIPWGDDVTVSMTVDLDSLTNEMRFEFGPHGCQFEPAATVYLNYKDLGLEVPTLYYIDENGNYIEQTPEDVDVTNKLIIIKIHHFSRYALSRG